MTNSESARKAGKVVGGALLQAKGAFSSFLSSFTAPNATASPADNFESHIKADTIENEPKEVTEPREGVIKQIAKRFHNNEMSLKQERDTVPNQQGIVEIGREANTLDSNRQSDVIDV